MLKLINIEEQDLQEAMFITILEVSELFLHTGRMNTLSTILEVINSSSILVKCIHICSNVLEPSSPNVLPEGLEQTIRMIDVLVPITLVTRQRWSTLL